MNTSKLPHADPERYYEQLDRFVMLCRELSASGKPYLAVVLCHELYRYLYPTEPYAKFEHRDPVPFMLQHIERLVELASLATVGVVGYESMSANVPGAPTEELERRTSDLYSKLWDGYDQEIMTRESVALLEKRVPRPVLDQYVRGKRVLDLGCGSGRYSIALSHLGAAHVTAVDFQAKSYAAAQSICQRTGMAVEFREANVLSLPFADRSFDFVWSNGVLHHTRSWKDAFSEYVRVLKTAGFLYLYATGGFFWTTRRRLREVFKEIPQAYTLSVLQTIGMPANRMIFMDTWYVPIEEHIGRAELESDFERSALRYEKLHSNNPFDLDRASLQQLNGAEAMWGEGEHRYLLVRS